MKSRSRYGCTRKANGRKISSRSKNSRSADLYINRDKLCFLLLGRIFIGNSPLGFESKTATIDVKANLDGLDALLQFYLDKKDSLKPLPKLLDGIEIMGIKNIKQSPELGEIINALKEAQINGEIITKEDAIAFVKEL